MRERSGAAGRALECRYRPYGGGGGNYTDGGPESVQDSPEDALANFLGEEGDLVGLPTDGYRLERADDGRALFSYDVADKTKVALIAADGITDYDDDEGWGIETWALCDPAELPGDVAEDLGYGVWRPESVTPVPVARVRSSAGPEHCDWEDITFLVLGPDDDALPYLRDTHGELEDLLRTTYDDSAVLPRGATDTGYRRNGRELWLVPSREAAYLVSAEDSADVERWPAASEPFGCA